MRACDIQRTHRVTGAGGGRLERNSPIVLNSIVAAMDAGLSPLPTYSSFPKNTAPAEGLVQQNMKDWYKLGHSGEGGRTA